MYLNLLSPGISHLVPILWWNMQRGDKRKSPWVVHASACLGSRTLCCRLLFKRCLYRKQPWKIGMVSPCRGRGRCAYCQV